MNSMPEPRIEIRHAASGGKGQITLKHLLEKEAMGEKCNLYAEVTIYPGSSLGYHEHHGNSETYYIISGEGEYIDDKITRRVKAGDVTFTPSGHGHGMTPVGDKPIVFMALIIND